MVGPGEYARLTGQTPTPKTIHWNGRDMTFVEFLMAIPKGGPDDLFERRQPKRREFDF